MTKKTKKSGAFEKIMAGMEDAIAFAQSDYTRGRVVRGVWSPAADAAATTDRAER